MPLIKIHGRAFEVPEEVAACMHQLQNERNWNYTQAAALQKRVDELSKSLKIIRGVSSEKRVKANTLFR